MYIKFYYKIPDQRSFKIKKNPDNQKFNTWHPD